MKIISEINQILENESMGVTDIVSSGKSLGFEVGEQRRTFDGDMIKVITLTKEESIHGMGVIYQYVINPETQSWLFRACLSGQTLEDMVEFKTGDSYESLHTHMKRKNKLTANQVHSYLNEPIEIKRGDDNV